MGTRCFPAPPGPEGEAVNWGEEGGLESGVGGGWQVGRLGARGQRGWGLGVRRLWDPHPSSGRNVRRARVRLKAERRIESRLKI